VPTAELEPQKHEQDAQRTPGRHHMQHPMLGRRLGPQQ
jgi:hypothetical protein